MERQAWYRAEGNRRVVWLGSVERRSAQTWGKNVSAHKPAASKAFVFPRNSPENVCLKYSTVQLTLNIFTNGKKTKEKDQIKPGTYVCTIVVVEEKKNKKKMEERIVVKLRRKQRSRWNNAMFYASRLTFPRNYASRNNGK